MDNFEYVWLFESMTREPYLVCRDRAGVVEGEKARIYTKRRAEARDWGEVMWSISMLGLTRVVVGARVGRAGNIPSG